MVNLGKRMTKLPFLLLAVFLTGCGPDVETLQNPKNHSFHVIAGPAIPGRRAGHIGGMLNRQMVIAAGGDWNDEHTQRIYLDDCWYFADGQWHPGPSLPERFYLSAFACDTKRLYTAGGSGPNGRISSVYYLDNITGNWQISVPLPRALSDAAAVITNDSLYVIGGTTDQGQTSQVLKIDLSEKNAVWEYCADIPGPARAWSAAFVLGQEIYLLGGGAYTLDESGAERFISLNDAYKYTPRSDRWIRLPDLAFKGYSWSAQPLNSETILITGRASEGIIYPDVYTLDIRTMEIVNVSRLVIETCAAALAGPLKNEYWVLGGEPGTPPYRTDVVSVIQVWPDN